MAVFTLQDPRYVAEDVGVGGDNDPLDVCEIGLRQISTGEVRQVKVLGILCLIDDGEADWKVRSKFQFQHFLPQFHALVELTRYNFGTTVQLGGGM